MAHNHTLADAGAHSHYMSQGTHGHGTVESNGGAHSHSSTNSVTHSHTSNSVTHTHTTTSAGAHSHTLNAGGAHTHGVNSSGAHGHTIDASRIADLGANTVSSSATYDGKFGFWANAGALYGGQAMYYLSTARRNLPAVSHSHSLTAGGSHGHALNNNTTP